MIVHYAIVHHCWHSSLQFIIICSFRDWTRFLHTLVYICCWFLFSYISCNNFFNILIKIKKITIKENKQIPTNKIESRRTAAHKRQQYNSTWPNQSSSIYLIFYKQHVKSPYHPFIIIPLEGSRGRRMELLDLPKSWFILSFLSQRHITHPKLQLRHAHHTTPHPPKQTIKIPYLAAYNQCNECSLRTFYLLVNIWI